jgi:hypothetical protein
MSVSFPAQLKTKNISQMNADSRGFLTEYLGVSAGHLGASVVQEESADFRGALPA